MNRFALVLAIGLFPELAFGQGDATCTSSAHFLGERANNVVCQPFIVDMTNKPVRVPKAAHVPNEVPLTVTVRHVINQTCSVNFKAASIASSANPLTVLLGTLVGLKVPTNYTSAVFIVEPEKAGCFKKISAPPTDAAARQINDDLHKLDEALIEQGTKLDTLANQFDTSDVAAEIKNLAFCIPSTDCATDAAFEAKKAQLLQEIQSLESELDLTPILQERARLKQAFGNWRDVNKGKETTWQGEVDAFFRCFDDKLKAVHSTAKTLKAQLDKLSDGLKKLSRTLDDSYVLPLYRNAKVTTDVVCSDKDAKALAGAPTDPKTAAATTPPVPIEINYQNPSALAGSAGVMISTLGQHVVGIQNRNVPNGSNGFTTFFAVTAHQPVQFIPFSLAHLFIYGTRTNNVSFSGGVGINTYNSSTQIEYFVGPSISTHNFYFSIGTHVGRFQDLGGGFKIGDPVPTGWTGGTAVPTTLRYTAHLGFGITYRIP